MDSEIATEPAMPQKPSSKGDRIEVVKVLALMVVSFAVGFGLVILFLRPDSDGAADTREDRASAPAEPPAPAVPAAKETASTQAPGYAAPEPAPPAEQPRPPEAPPAEPDVNRQADAPPEVPPGRTPPGVEVSGAPLYLKCWDKDGRERPGEACGRLNVFEKRFDSRLYVVNSCKVKHAGESAQGKLSLGVDVDFTKTALSFWNGSGTTLPEGANIAGCLRGALAGLPIGGIEPKEVRYRIFFTVVFAAPAPKEPDKAAVAPGPGVLKKGKILNVVKDKVRVRRTPGAGEVIGRISSGNQVRLIESKSGWCLVATPNNNEGWMTCDALGQP